MSNTTEENETIGLINRVFEGSWGFEMHNGGIHQFEDIVILVQVELDSLPWISAWKLSSLVELYRRFKDWKDPTEALSRDEYNALSEDERDGKWASWPTVLDEYAEAEIASEGV